MFSSINTPPPNLPKPDPLHSTTFGTSSFIKVSDIASVSRYTIVATYEFTIRAFIDPVVFIQCVIGTGSFSIEFKPGKYQITAQCIFVESFIYNLKIRKNQKVQLNLFLLYKLLVD